jgi:hypothetical protein
MPKFIGSHGNDIACFFVTNDKIVGGAGTTTAQRAASRPSVSVNVTSRLRRDIKAAPVYFAPRHCATSALPVGNVDIGSALVCKPTLAAAYCAGDPCLWTGCATQSCEMHAKHLRNTRILGNPGFTRFDGLRPHLSPLNSAFRNWSA